MPHSGHYAQTAPPLYHQPPHHVLIKIQIRCLLQHFPPLLSKQHSVVLGARTPHGRTLAPIQHPELDHGQIRHNSRIPTHRINFPHDLPLGNPTHRGITAHLGNGLHVHGDQQGFRPQIGRRRRRFTAGVASTHHDHIILWKHAAKLR